MASWHRFVVDNFRRVSLLHGRWYSSLGYGGRKLLTSRGGLRPVSSKVPGESGGVLPRLGDSVQYVVARSFAAPVPVRTKEEPKVTQGPRLNEAITARFIRLVSDEGHAVVSREEALGRARRLDLDLVEVQRTAKPPVCKIMDYHKEKYKKETTEKERAKSKSDLTIRKGDFKEVRLKGKIEQKDIEVKAETVKGLIERGYRVKCMALPSKQSGMEESDLGALLSRLTDLIEDVIIVESGPFMEKQQAYVVVRHVKFGSKKGTRKKATKTVETTSGTEMASSTTTIAFDSATTEAVEPMDISEVTDEEGLLLDPKIDVQDLPSSATSSPLTFESVANRNVDGSNLIGNSDNRAAVMSGMTERSHMSKTVYGSTNSRLESERDHIDRHVPPKPSIFHSPFSAEDSNRYGRRIEMKFRSDQTKPAGRSGMVNEEKGIPDYSRFSSANGANKFSRSPGMANSRWMEQQISNQGKTPRQPPAYENQNQEEHLVLKQGHILPNDSSPPPSYGIFSSQNLPTSDVQRTADVQRDKQRNLLSHNNNAPNIPKSKAETTEQNIDNTKQGGWGIFSRPISNPSQDNSFGQR